MPPSLPSPSKGSNAARAPDPTCHAAKSGVSRRLFAIAGNVDAELAASISFDKATGKLENIHATGKGELKIGACLG